MRRLEELLRQFASVCLPRYDVHVELELTLAAGSLQAAKSIGNTELEEKFTQSIEKIKRDIVFAASLYL